MSDSFAGASGRTYTPLPVDSTMGFPQEFTVQCEQHLYRFRLYVNIDADELRTDPAIVMLPSAHAFMVARVDREDANGERSTIFLRKVVPELEYETSTIVLAFPRQVLAKANINQPGDFGTDVQGGIAARWV